MIQSFRDAATKKCWETGRSARLPPAVRKRALNKLFMLHNAEQLQDMASPPSNRLEALRGGRQGQHSIRVNDQWRIC